MLGKDQPVILQLLEITPALDALAGTAMEIEDCAFPLVADIVQTDDPDIAFRDAEYCLLVGARPRGPGMERKDLLQANAKIFSSQGVAMDRWASRKVKVLVVGNPANTNCLIAYRNATHLDPAQFTAMTRLDHNRAIAQTGGPNPHAQHRGRRHDYLGQSFRHPVSGHSSLQRGWPPSRRTR